MVGRQNLKDAAREIRKSILRFAAVTAIVALGTAFFVGIRMASPDMKQSATEYFSGSNYMDFTLLSAAGFTSDDVAAIRAAAGVKGVMPAYSADAVTDIAGEQKVLHILSLPPVGTASADSINQPHLLSGRLPERDDECVVEHNNFTGVNYALGDRISLSGGGDTDLLDTLTANTFTVVGIVDSPLYVGKDRGTAAIGSGTVAAFMEVSASAFKLPVYTALYVTAADTQGKAAYSTAYDDAAAPVKAALDALGSQRAAQWMQEMQEQALQAMQAQAGGNTADAAANNAAASAGITSSTESANSVGGRAIGAMADGAAADSGISIPAVTWYVLGRDANVGYTDYGSAADRVAQIALVFPVVFIFVALLVCLTGMSRMVEEQRTQMGVIKALGYSRGTAAFKFLLFALLASVAGCAVGLAFGFTLFPYIICHTYKILYTVPYSAYTVTAPYIVGALAAALAVTGLSALVTCYGELKFPAAQLMRPRAPKPGRRILLERVRPLWTHMTFTQKTTARNLFRYKSRSLMTIAGVALCTALLLVGFGLNDAVRGLGPAQFGGIDQYQCEITLQQAASPDDVQNLNDYIAALPGYQSMQHVMIKAVDTRAGASTGTGGTKSVYLVVPETPDALPQYISLKDSVTGAALALNDNGVIVSQKLAQLLKVKAGDTLSLAAGADEQNIDVTVSGVCENYLYHYVYMSPALYQSLTGSAPVYNAVDVHLSPYDKANNSAMSAGIIAQPGAAQVSFMTDRISLAADITRSIFSIVLVLIVSAALLSFIVLFTLTTINIGERLREIATIRVLGFSHREAAGYVLRENLLLALIGTVFGLLLGVPLTRYIASTAEVENIHFVPGIHPLSFLLAAALTVAFALLVDVSVRPRLRRIHMVEALKTVE